MFVLGFLSVCRMDSCVCAWVSQCLPYGLLCLCLGFSVFAVWTLVFVLGFLSVCRMDSCVCAWVSQCLPYGLLCLCLRFSVDLCAPLCLRLCFSVFEWTSVPVLAFLSVCMDSVLELAFLS